MALKATSHRRKASSSSSSSSDTSADLLESTLMHDADGTGYLEMTLKDADPYTLPTPSRPSGILDPIRKLVRRLNLCWQCRLYCKNIEALLAPSPLPRTVRDANLVGPASSYLHGPCALCQALETLSANASFQAGDRLEVWITNVLTDRERLSCLERDVESPMGIVVGRNRAAFRRVSSAGARVRMDCQRDSILVAERCKSSPYGAQAIDRALFDAYSAASWVKDCCQNHTKCRVQASVSFDISVIDCLYKVIVRREPGMPYLALSYVWGERSLSQGPRGFNAASAPRVIRDAMSVTTRMGFRYLWVDRYCIPQDDESEMVYQIGIMHRIYENSTVTIVAAVSEHDEDGLPGAGTNPPILREEQTMLQLGSVTLISTRPGVREAIKGSKWLTRGWTYQESLMSPRCLLFTKSKVFLVCKTTTMSESIPRLPRRTVFEDHHTTESLFGGRVDETAQEQPLDSLERSITTYLSRDLGRASDSLNAFKAILSRSEHRSYWGIPLLFYDLARKMDAFYFEAYTLESRTRQAFLNGLCWFVQKQSKSWIMYSNATRRPDNPTWSWTSLKNAAVKFHQRRDHKQAPDWRYTVRCSDARVWLYNTRASVGDVLWTEISRRFLDEKSHVLKEGNRLLMLQTAAVEVVRAEVPLNGDTYRDSQRQSYFAPQNEHFEWTGGIHVFTRGNEGDPRAYIPVNLDCGQHEYDEIRDATPGSTFKPRRWRLVLIAETCITTDGGPTAVRVTGNGWRKFFLLLQERNLGMWYRIGSTEITGDVELSGLAEQVMILA